METDSEQIDIAEKIANRSLKVGDLKLLSEMLERLKNLGLTHAQISEKLKIDRTLISRIIRLASVPTNIAMYVTDMLAVSNIARAYHMAPALTLQLAQQAIAADKRLTRVKAKEILNTVQGQSKTNNCKSPLENMGRLGFSFDRVETLDGSEVYRLDTPFLLDNEFPYDIFVEWKDEELHLFDEGLTWHSIGAMGYRLNEENFKRYRDFMEENGVTVEDDAVLSLTGLQMDARVVVARFLTACVLLDKNARKMFTYV